MDIVSNQTNKKRHTRLSFHKNLFFFGTGIFTLFLFATFAYQYNREKHFRKELINDVLQGYNYIILQNIEKDSTSIDKIDNLIHFITDYDLRVTIMDKKGNVLKDNKNDSIREWENHIARPEVKGALRNGRSFALRRSSTFEEPFFYSARKSDHFIVRSALPFNHTTLSLLKVDPGIIIFFIFMAIGFLVMIFFFSLRLGHAISTLREFSYKAEKDELQDLNVKLPANDIGDITGHIIRLYTKLDDAKKEILIEKEKLIKHLQISKEGLCVFSADKKSIFTNTLFIQYVNLISDKEIALSEDIFSVKECSTICEFINAQQKAQTTPLSNYLSEQIVINKNGKSFHIECIVFPDHSFEISINNITQLEEETRLKRQLTQNVAHELKTPVSSIKGFLETIINNPKMDIAIQQQFIERCYAQTNRLTVLLSDLSVLNRMEEAYDQFDKEQVNIANLVNEIISDSHPLLLEKNMKVQMQVPNDIIVYGNPMLLFSIFRNLMDNSIAYAGEGKNIIIRCYRQDSDAYYFSFSDNGIGIEEKHLNRIFERFYRVDKGRSRKLGGTGLGLSIVKNAVVFHGGEISAKIRPEGGLEFLFSLKRIKEN